MSEHLLSIQNLAKSHDGRPLLTEINLGVDSGDKIGIIGANGAGKSTLLRLLDGQLSPDAGTVSMRKGVNVGFLAQEPALPGHATIRACLDACFAELRKAIRAYEQAAVELDGDADRWLQRIEELGGWEYQHRIEAAASTVQLFDLDRIIDTLSGGERKRVALARLLLEEPDLIILDEPTNHLDASTVDWLEQWLTGTRATVILVTHDRYFLDAVVTRLVEVRDGQLHSYRGNYTDYLAARALEEAHRERVRHRQLRILMGELDWAKRSPKARTTKARARLERIEEVQEEVGKLADKRFQASFKFGEPPRLGSIILELDDVGAGYDEAHPLIADLSLKMRRGERLGILGPNGAGKSTLLRLIMGQLKPKHGRLKLGANTKVAYFDQVRSGVEPHHTVMQTIVPDGGNTVFPGGGAPVHVAAWLDRFGFDASTHQRPVSTLSGGERNRLAIARFLLTDANLLILDEPTNDLDLTTLNVLEEAILDFEGCVLIVSHDRYMLDKVCTGIIAFERDYLGDGAVTFVQGDYTHYAEGRLQELRDAKAAAERAQQAEERKARQAAKEAANTPAEAEKKRGLTYAEKRELEGLEPKIHQLEQHIEALETRLADPDLWRDSPDEGRRIQSELDAAREQLDADFLRWTDLMER